MIFKNIDYFTFFQNIEIDGIVYDLHNDFLIKDSCFTNQAFILKLKSHCNACSDLVIIFKKAKLLMGEKLKLNGLSISDIFRQQWARQIDYTEQKDEMLMEILFEGENESLILTCSEYEITKYTARSRK